MIILKKVISNNQAGSKFVPGVYESKSGKYRVEKGTIGWNLYEKDPNRPWLDHLTGTYETLRDIKNDPDLHDD